MINFETVTVSFDWFKVMVRFSWLSDNWVNRWINLFCFVDVPGLISPGVSVPVQVPGGGGLAPQDPGNTHMTTMGSMSAASQYWPRIQWHHSDVIQAAAAAAEVTWPRGFHQHYTSKKNPQKRNRNGKRKMNIRQWNYTKLLVEIIIVIL